MIETMKENQSNTKSIPEKETSVGINIALGKPASQSSRSKWSKPDDPQGAVNGIKTGSFGFHTDFEIQPWWQVDLENLYEISQIKIFNRENAGLKCADRAKSLSVFTSIDGMTWEVIHKQDQSFGGYLSQKPLLVECNNKVARFVRIQLNGKNALHLDEVEIYGIPFQAEGSQFSLDPPKTFNFIDYKGQLLQDKWVVMMTKGKQKGVFLEIGSTDGVELNNTFCLEKNFSWSGICVEPNPDYFRKLCVNRTAITLPYAFYKQSGQIVEFVDHGVLGTISDFLSTDLHASSREKFVSKKGTIKVITACPEDILNLYKFPDNFDFLSLDVEGAELDVLEAFNLSKWHPALACVEHNYVADKRLAIFELLSSHGYQRIQCGFDDWYYNLGILQVLNPEIPLSHYKEVLEYFCVYHHCKLVDEASFHNAKSLVKEKVSDSVVINEINPNSAQLQSSSGSALSATETSKDGINLNPNPNLNLALNKPTAQSSVYQPEQYGYDPQGACNGKKNGKFGFCTLKENQPWWQIDLQEIYQLSEIRIYNRINCKERASTLDVLLSQDALNWELCYSNAQENLFGGIDGNPLIADMQQKFTRFVRLQLRENEYLHLDEVEIYGSPFQPDGSGLKSSQNEATLAANFYGQAGCLPPSPSPDQIKQIALKSSKGIIHVGAHKGQEAEFYASNNKSVIWVEALPQVFATLEKKVAEYPNQQAINALVTDTDGKEYKFNISNNSVSSSLFEFGDAKDNLFPQLKMVDSARLVGKTLSTIYREFNIDGSKFDFLLLDVQGAELMVLKGAESVLHNFKYILAEISTVNIYKNGVLWDELKTFLNEKGFKEAISVKPSRHCDVLFIRETGGKIEN
jgi:FkbM family methyltransferase